MAEALQVPVEPAPRQAPPPPVWVQHYPEALQPALTELAGVADDAERIAGGVLGKDCPHPDDLRQEIAAIERKLAACQDQSELSRDQRELSMAFLQQKLNNLRLRLRSPRLVSPVRLDRLRAKLEARTRRCLIESWQRRLNAELTAAFSRLLEADEVPAWMFEPPQLRVLESMTRLPGAFRSLGWRLFGARASSGPWNLVDDPANRAYLERVRECGVDVEPWLDPRPRSCVGENGRKVELAVERDPLEVFQMGHHFRTCLSPRRFSFFSVFSVAADINKHVVYARDASRAVVGRCLLALDGQGRILTFHPYCHDAELGFDKMVGALVRELADQMKTSVVKRGTVACLVASRWYDDGPVDVCGRFAFLEEGSEFRESLSNLAGSDELAACLEKQFAPMPLNGHALSLVLELPEFDAHPDLIRSLLPRLDACEDLDDRTWMRAVRVAASAGESDFVGRALRRRGVRYGLRTRYRAELDGELMSMLVEHDPGAAIRLVRATRERGVRSDEDDEEQRRSYLASAFERLGRPIRARRVRAGRPEVPPRTPLRRG